MECVSADVYAMGGMIDALLCLILALGFCFWDLFCSEYLIDGAVREWQLRQDIISQKRSISLLLQLAGLHLTALLTVDCQRPEVFTQ